MVEFGRILVWYQITNCGSAMRLIPLQSLCFQDPLLLLICTTVPSKANEVYRLTVERDETLEELLANFLKA